MLLDAHSLLKLLKNDMHTMWNGVNAHFGDSAMVIFVIHASTWQV